MGGDDDDCSKPVCMDSPFGNLRKNLGQALEVQCPLDKQQLGRFSWALLHTFAAYYPEKPSQTDKDAMKGLILGFKQLYPCKHCRGHFQKDCQRDPPNFEDHKQMNIWMCRQHNYVNKMLGKAQFQCKYENLMKRWKTGCDVDDL